MFNNLEIPKDLIPSDPRFGSGPSLVPVEFLENLAKTGASYMGTSHRKPAVRKVVKEIQDGLREYFDIPKDYLVVLGNGGATLLFDMISLGMVKKQAAHFTCGEFSEKWFKAAKQVPWIKTKQFSVEAGLGINPVNDLESDLIATTLNETSTGVQISKLCEVDADTILAVDATSGAGQVACDISKVDIFYFSPQKVFASDGGLWIAILSPKAQKRAEEIASDKSRYIPEIMKWEYAISNAKNNQTYNTPALATLFIMNEQVKLMNQMGRVAVEELAKKKAELLYSWASEKPYLSAFITQEEFRSVAVTTIDVDPKVNCDDVIKFLEDKNYVHGIDGYRKLGRNQFRISIFHNISYEDLEKLTKLLSFMIESVK